MRVSKRSAVDPFIVMDVVEKARQAEAQGRRIIHMEVGQPAKGAPAAAIERLQHDMRHDALGYTVSTGLSELRRKIAALYGQWYDLDLNPERVIVTSGASGAFLLAFTALFDTDERVGLGAPCYPSYRQILKSLGLTPVDLPTTVATRFQPVPEYVAAMDLQGMIVASPANPTGTMLERDDIKALADACRDNGAALISDEIYHGLSYDKPCVTAASVADDIFVINSFSKYFRMTGWRVGWMVVPESHIRIAERIAQNQFICTSHAAQKLALYAMDCHDELQAAVADYAQNRDAMIKGLTQAGFTKFSQPDGAFYIYCDVSDFTDDSVAFADHILDKACVAVTPGVDFDKENGHKSLRFSYAGAHEDILEGLQRLNAFMKERTAG